MKKMFKLLSVVLSLVMIITMFVPMTESAQAAQAKLNYSKKTIYVGSKLTLKVTGTNKKVKWTSSDKYVASVSAKGVVKGKYAGKATITANVSGKKLTCKITVKEKPVVTYITNRSVEYNKEDNVHRFFFGFLDQNEKDMTEKGSVDLRIENGSDVVYKKTVKFSKNDFSTWTWNYGSIKKYVCCIEIPEDQIKEGKNTSGTLYYTVRGKDAEFDEFSLKIYDLPQKGISVVLPTLPAKTFDTVSLRDSNGRYFNGMCDINIDDIKVVQNGSSSVKLTFTGSVTPTISSITWVESRRYYFTVKLIKDGITVTSTMAATPNIYLNDRFSTTEYFYNLEQGEEYSLEICAYH